MNLNSAALLAAPVDPESGGGRDASLALGNRSAVFFETGRLAGTEFVDERNAIQAVKLGLAFCTRLSLSYKGHNFIRDSAENFKFIKN